MPDQEYEAWITSVREATDIVEVIGRYVMLKRKGKNFWGLCPFHQEKTPSFSVDPEQKLYYCFGCHAGGTVFTFLVQKEGREFRDVVSGLAEQAGIELPTRDNARSPLQEAKQRIREVLEWTLDYFLVSARESYPFNEYLAQRAVSDALRDRFRIGYAPDQWQGLVEYLTAHGVDHALMENAGVVVRRHQGAGVVDRWRDRVMIPIWDRDGKIAGFGGRALSGHQEPKYLNSPDTPMFRKGTLLYGSHWARAAWRRGQRPLLVEGYFDVVGCHKADLTQAVATMGTSLTEGQARYLARFSQEVDLMYDADAAGQAATERAFLVLSGAGLKVNAVSLPPDVKDPDECVTRLGPVALRDAVEARVPYVTAILNHVATAPEVMTPRGKASATERLKPLWKAIADPVEQVGYLEQIAQKLRINPSILSQSFGVWQGARHTFGKNRHNMERTESKPARPSSYAVELLQLLLRHPEKALEVLDRVREWAEDAALVPVLQDIAAGTANRDTARWIESVDPALRDVVVAAVHYEGPDGGILAINDYIVAIERQTQLRRWNQLKERIRQGDATPDVLEAVRKLQQELNTPNIRTKESMRQGKEGSYGTGETHGTSN